MTERTRSIRTLATLVAALRGWGADVEKGLARADLISDQVENHDWRVSIARYRTVWDAACEETGDDAIGLHVLEYFDLQGVLSTLIYIASSSATGCEAFQRVSPFIRTAHEAIEIELFVEEDKAICKAGFRGWAEDRTLNEYFLGLIMKIAPAIVGPDSSFSAWFRHGAPEYALQCQSIFGTDVRFESPFNAVVGSLADLDRPLPRADSLLFSLLERQASDALARMPQASSFEETVRQEIERLLPNGELSAEGVARSLGLSARRLRRRLNSCESSYRRVLDGVRCDLARRVLSKPDASVREVSYSLGFSATSDSHKAFCRWTGKRPSELTSTRHELRARSFACHDWPRLPFALTSKTAPDRSLPLMGEVVG